MVEFNYLNGHFDGKQFYWMENGQLEKVITFSKCRIVQSE